MNIKYKGKTVEVPDHFIIACGEHAESRGMTLEEYIAEAFERLEKDGDKENIFNQDTTTLAGSDRLNNESDRQT